MAKLHPFWYLVPPAVIYEMFGGSGLWQTPQIYFSPYHSPDSFTGARGTAIRVEAQIVMPFDGVLRTFWLWLDSSPEDEGGTYVTLTVMKNAGNTVLSVTVSGADNYGSNEVDTVSFVKGDRINLVADSDVPDTKIVLSWGCEIAHS